MGTVTAGSLFSGIGGLDLAAAAAGFDIRFQVEIEEFPRRVLEKHAKYWPNAVRYGDIRLLTGRDVGYTDILFGGFPCQDISVANHEPRGIAGPRSGLWREFARLIGEIRPRAILLENVPAITVRGLDTVISDITQLGYDARWGIISAADAGAPQIRRRWWLLGYARPAYLRQTHLRTTHLRPTHGELAYASSEGLAGASGWSKTLAGIARRSEADTREVPRSGMGRDANGLSKRLDKHRFPGRPHERQPIYEPARLTARRLHRKERIQALGNAVVPQVAYPLFCELMDWLR